MLWRISVTTFSLLEYNDINKCQQSTKPNETVASVQHETARQWAYATCNEERTDVDGRRVEDCMDDTETMIAKSWCSIRSGRRNGISKINIKSNESTRQSQFRRHVYHTTKLTLTPPESQELWCLQMQLRRRLCETERTEDILATDKSSRFSNATTPTIQYQCAGRLDFNYRQQSTWQQNHYW